MGGMPIIYERQPGTPIELIEIAYLDSDAATRYIRITNNKVTPPLKYQGTPYDFNACGISGVITTPDGNGTPILTICVINGRHLLDIIKNNFALSGALVTQTRTFAEYLTLDREASFSTNFEPAVWRINQLTNLTSNTAAFQLLHEVHNQNHVIPKNNATSLEFSGLTAA